MTGVSNDVSVYYLAVHNDNVRPAGIVLFILITLGYTVYITSWAIFQVSTFSQFLPLSSPFPLFNLPIFSPSSAAIVAHYSGQSQCKQGVGSITIHPRGAVLQRTHDRSSRCSLGILLPRYILTPLFSPYISSGGDPFPIVAIVMLGWISENGLRTGDYIMNDAPYVYNGTEIFNVTSNSTYIVYNTTGTSSPFPLQLA